MAEIKVGNTVRLKSGGPLMAVDKVQDVSGILSASCTWFNLGNHEDSLPHTTWFACSILDVE